MAEYKQKAIVILVGVLSVILLLGLVRIFIAGSGKFFALELMGFFILLALTVAGLVGYASFWGKNVLFFMFLLYIINLALLWLYLKDMYFVLLILAVIGFLLSIPSRVSHPPKKSLEERKDFEKEPSASAGGEPHSMVFEPAAKEEKKSKKATASFTPGKYIASSRSNVYHAPKCEWGNNIALDHRVWFAGKEEAWQKGFRGHSCITE
ncbi:MAG: hypothetical protein AABX37_02635 [Nanoarchaeota archaeon]